MTKSQKLEKEIVKVREQLASLQAKLKDLEEQKHMAERAEKIEFMEKNHISSEQLQLLIKFGEEELKRLLAEKEKENARNEEKVIGQYIEGIYNTILLKDVATREKINDVSVLENILKTVASSIGSPISIKKISDTLISSGRKISPNTVEAYLRALTDS